MSKGIQIQIPEPCHEDWNKMTPVEKGHFCNSCKKVVRDFSGMSDEQLIAFFRKPNDNVTCGRFSEDQLNRNLANPRKRLPWLRYFFQFIIPVFLTNVKANSQDRQIAEKKKGSLEWNSSSSVDKIIGDTTTNLSLQVVIRGKVVDSRGKSVAFPSVIIKGTKIGVSGDAEGLFKLVYRTNSKTLTLSASSVGYITSELQISTNELAGKEPVIVMDSDTSLGLTDVAITAGAFRTVKNEKAFNLERTIQGRVLDANGTGISYASVMIKGTKNGCSTDSSGYFKIRIPDISKTNCLIFSCVSFESLEKCVDFSVNENSEMVVELQPVVMEAVNIVCYAPTMKGRLQVMGLISAGIKKEKIRSQPDPILQVLEIFPNPARSNGEVNLRIKDLKPGEYSLEVLTIQGQVLKHFAESTIGKNSLIQIRLPYLPSGTYLISVTNNTTLERYTQQLVIIE